MEESLQRYRGVAEAPCPICGIITETADTNDLVNNYVVLRGVRARCLCDSCDDAVMACHRCIDCGLALCAFHLKDHRRSRGTKSHKVIKLKEVGERGIQSVLPSHMPLYCPQHQHERAKLFCSSPCAKLICHDCSILSHKGHEFTLLPQAEEKHRGLLRKHVARSQERLAVIQESLQSMKETEDSVKSNCQNTERMVLRTFSNLRQAIDLREKTLVKALKRIEEVKVRALSRQIKALEKVVAAYDTALDTAGLCLDQLHCDEFMATGPCIEQRMDALQQQAQSLQLEPCVDDHISFSCDKGILDCARHQISKLGSVNSISAVKEAGSKVQEQEQVEGTKLHFNLEASVGVHPRHVGFAVPTDKVVVEVRGGSEAEVLSGGKEGPLIGRVILVTQLEGAGQTSFQSEQLFESLSQASNMGSSSSASNVSTSIPTVRFTKVLRVAKG
ncbi:unnamed protein product [Choristocarpus tenellus]